MLSFSAALQVVVVPGQIPPPAAFVEFGRSVLSIERVNEKVPVPDVPRTQNEIPL